MTIVSGFRATMYSGGTRMARQTSFEGGSPERSRLGYVDRTRPSGSVWYRTSSSGVTIVESIDRNFVSATPHLHIQAEGRRSVHLGQRPTATAVDLSCISD